MATKPFTLVSILVLCFAANAFGFDLNKGLKAYYPFNGNANDVSGNNNNPSFNNATLATDYYGQPNSAYYFNGVNSFMRIPNSSSLNTAGPISICAWIKPMGFYKGTCHGNRIIMKGDADYLTGNYFLTYDDNLYTNGSNCSTSVVDTIHQTLYAPSTGVLPQNDTPYIQMNVWSSLVYTYDGDRAKLYINCKLVLDYPVKNLTFTNSYDLFFGKMNHPLYPYWFNGILDEVRIYDRPLDESEVQEYSFGCAAKLPCSNWLQTKNTLSGVQIGDLDISGQQMTVEAVFNRTAPYTGGRLYAGDLVSKHTGPANTNYLLRPSSAEITTTKGYFITPGICDIDLNKVYHVAMVYDGKELKFYRNGYLMSKVSCSGDLLTNDLITTIGSISSTIGGGPDESFLGYINEVRIWNIARTQEEIKTTMNGPLPNPFKKNGLLAYYSFEDLKNKQGDSPWDAKLINNAVVNAANPLCNAFVADSCNIIPSPSNLTVLASFSTPDTVCVNTPVTIKNTSVGASSYYWNFCVADIDKAPIGNNLGNIGGAFQSPVYIDYALENGNYYGFVNNNATGELIRLEFGNSLLNTPTAIVLGTLGVIPKTSEGIQVVKNEGKWYVFLVGGDAPVAQPYLIKVELGANINNNNPVATNLGNVGNMAYPHDLYMFKDGDNWYGLVASYTNSSIVRINFTSSFNNTPSGTNLGNIGKLKYPTGVQALKENNNWYVFATNAGDSTITRLDFGTSLLNTPTGVNLGNIGKTLDVCWDIYILDYCERKVGFVINGTDGTIVKLDFGGSLGNTPSAMKLPNIGNLSFPHCLSRIFRVGADLYTFITNVNNNTLTRLKFSGCTNSSISNSSDETPSAIKYDTPGTYNINLTIDEGLQTQATTCKRVVVLAPLAKMPLKDTTLCADSIILKSRFVTENLWNDGSKLDSVIIKQNGDYWVNTDFYGCAARDSFKINIKAGVSFSLGNDSSFCKGDTIRLRYIKSPGEVLQWQDGSSAEQFNVFTAGKYKLRVTTSLGCTGVDSVSYTMNNAPLVKVMNDTTVCGGTRLTLYADLSATDSVRWSPSVNLSNIKVGTPVATIMQDISYILTGYKDGCAGMDTLSIGTRPAPVLAKSNDTSICRGESIQLVVTGADHYQWLPLRALSSYNVGNPIASPAAIMKYYIIGSNANGCTTRDSIVIDVKEKTVFSLPPYSSNICAGDSVTIAVRGDGDYEWLNDIDNVNINAQAVHVAPASSTQYVVVAKDQFCHTSDTLRASVTVRSLPAISLYKSNDIDCVQGESKLTVFGGAGYSWSPSQFLSDAQIFNPIAKTDSTTTFVVKVTGQNGCISKDSITVYVNKTNGNSYPIINAFTPNGDGLNDYFGIKYWGYIKDYEMNIFNRWGQLLFTSSNPDKKWDGTFKGELQPSGTYVYRIKATTLCGPVIKNGSIVLIK